MILLLSFLVAKHVDAMGTKSKLIKANEQRIGQYNNCNKNKATTCTNIDSNKLLRPILALNHTKMNHNDVKKPNQLLQSNMPFLLPFP